MPAGRRQQECPEEVVQPGTAAEETLGTDRLDAVGQPTYRDRVARRGMGRAGVGQVPGHTPSPMSCLRYRVRTRRDGPEAADRGGIVPAVEGDDRLGELVGGQFLRFPQAALIP